jgi:hypothetical protein
MAAPFPGDLTGFPGGFEDILAKYHKQCGLIALGFSLGKEDPVAAFKRALEFTLFSPTKRPKLTDEEKMDLSEIARLLSEEESRIKQ